MPEFSPSVGFFLTRQLCKSGGHRVEASIVLNVGKAAPVNYSTPLQVVFSPPTGD
ncbi:hypothetical protein FRB90_002310 [Tulasnella sp. 427]|nr:hypothetical protein FRB90_002310 [Tulasnella sp. 427]